MKNKKFKNEEKDFLKENTNEINDKDILNTITLLDKTIGNNFSIMLSEMSNNALYKIVEEIYLSIKENAHKSYQLAYSNGWYTIEASSDSKISEALKKSEQMKNE